MRLHLIDELAMEVSNANSSDQLTESMSRAARLMDFDHFALSYEHHTLSTTRAGVLIHDYPEPWAILCAAAHKICYREEAIMRRNAA